MTLKQVWSVATILFLAMALGTYWGYTQRFESSHQAFLHSDSIMVATEVDGTVAKVHVKDNQIVKAGDVLFELDPTSFDIAIAHAKATLADARREVKTRNAAVETALVTVKQREVDVQNAKIAAERVAMLMNKGLATKQMEQDVAAKTRAAEMALSAAKAALNETKFAAGKPGDLNPKVRQAKAELQKANWAKEKTKVLAIADGWVTTVPLQAGQVVRKGEPQFSLISNHRYWVEANFKAAQLRRIKPGQVVKIKLVEPPLRTLQGEVMSVSNEAGVRVRVLDNDPIYPLRKGAPVSVRVKVKSGSVAPQDR